MERCGSHSQGFLANSPSPSAEYEIQACQAFGIMQDDGSKMSPEMLLTIKTWEIHSL